VAYDEDLANRIRELIAGDPPATEKQMFGGLAFLIGGHMAVAASGQGGLLVRCDPEQTETLLAEPSAGPMVMRGREMAGWLRVDAEGVETQEQLEPWVRRGVAYTQSMFTSHGMPKRSVHMPNVSPHICFSSGMLTVPSADSASQ
jgi:TfoX/Sxy family transcriptional regulator of competence genes